MPFPTAFAPQPPPPMMVPMPMVSSSLIDTLRQMAARSSMQQQQPMAMMAPVPPMPHYQQQQLHPLEMRRHHNPPPSQQAPPPQQSSGPKLYANRRPTTSYLPPVNERVSSGRSENEFRAEPPAILMKTDFRDLHVFNSRILDPLYRGAGKACPNCGRRFPSQEVYSQHMDWHFKQNAREKSRLSRGQSRAWYVGAAQWHNDVAGDAASVAMAANVFSAKNNEQQPAQEEPGDTAGVALPVMRVLADEEHGACAICSERFDRVWDDSEETWVFEGALRCGNNSICHVDCFNGATEQVKEQLMQ